MLWVKRGFLTGFRSAKIHGRSFSTSSNQKIAFIGLGNMGFPMVSNLMAKSNLNVSVFDTNDQVLQLATREGAQVSKSPEHAATGASYIITMLPGNDQVKGVYDQILANSKPAKNAICIDCSTVSPVVSQEVSEKLAKHSFQFADAPVSGGVGGAKAGTLTFMVGGPKKVYDNISTKVLNFMGKNIMHCGEKPGSGEAAKLCNNLILACSMASVSEALNLGQRLGVDPKVLSGIVNTSTGRCWSSDTYNPYPGVIAGVPSSNGYAGGFASKLMLKDLGLALDAAKASGSANPMGKHIQALYQELADSGLADKDFSVMFEYLAKKSG